MGLLCGMILMPAILYVKFGEKVSLMIRELTLGVFGDQSNQKEGYHSVVFTGGCACPGDFGVCLDHQEFL